MGSRVAPTRPSQWCLWAREGSLGALASRGQPSTHTRNLFLGGRNEIFEKCPKLAADLGYTNFFLASDPPPPPPRRRIATTQWSNGDGYPGYRSPAHRQFAFPQQCNGSGRWCESCSQQCAPVRTEIWRMLRILFLGIRP